MNGQKTRMNSSVGRATSSDTFSDCCSATVLGASSPSTMCSAVMRTNERTTLRVCAMPSASRSPSSANDGSNSLASAGSPIHPRARLAIVMPSCVAAM